jgi:MFS transporter, DHA2 family, multidrug resistance protein
MESEIIYPAPEKRMAIMIVVMAASIMQIIDTTIANVALPHMRATLGATQEQISWVITSYAVATAIAIPATGFLEGKFGRRNLFMMSLSGFIISSALCGLAWSLPMMVVARISQGLFGAFITPLGQSVIYSTFPPESRAKSMAIWGIGIMIAPIVGPVLGGWLTDHISWRWVYFINVPIGIPTMLFLYRLLGRGTAEPRTFDWRGYALIALGLAALQLALDRGTSLDWFDSSEILLEIGIGVSALWMFAMHTRFAKAPLIPREVWTNRNIIVAGAFAFVNSGSMVMAATLVSLMVQGMMGYNTIDAGLIGLPRGISMAFAMMLAGRLVPFVDVRLMMGTGLMIVSLGFWIMTGFAPGMDSKLILISAGVQGIGFGLIMLPMSLMGFATISVRLRTEAAALSALFRSMGMSVIISISTAIVARSVQVSHSDQASQITSETAPILGGGLTEQLGIPGQMLLGMIDMEANRQALMIAYIDVYWMMGWLSLVILPLLLLVRWNPAAENQPEAPMAEAH